MWKSLVEPSETIEEKYRSWIILDIDGRTHTGVIAERSDTEIRLLANPLDNEKPVTIAIDDIDEEIESKISMMPQGQPERAWRAVHMFDAMEDEGFGACSNTYECEAACPKEISTAWIARGYRDYLKGRLLGDEE